MNKGQGKSGLSFMLGDYPYSFSSSFFLFWKKKRKEKKVKKVPSSLLKGSVNFMIMHLNYWIKGAVLPEYLKFARVVAWGYCILLCPWSLSNLELMWICQLFISSSSSTSPLSHSSLISLILGPLAAPLHTFPSFPFLFCFTFFFLLGGRRCTSTTTDYVCVFSLLIMISEDFFS